MKKIKVLISQLQAENEKSDFIQFLKNKSIPPQKRLAYLPYGVYFVMTFADINRLLLPQASNSDRIQQMINTHGEEDGRHWAWFLHDIDKMGYNKEKSFNEMIKFIWSNESVETRLFCYKIIGYCLNPDPLLKLVLIEAFEAMGKIWLDNSVAVAREMGLQDELIYLGQHHSDREIGHAIGTEEKAIEEIILPEDKRKTAEMIVYDLFEGTKKFYQELLHGAEKQDPDKCMSMLRTKKPQEGHNETV